MTRLLIFFGVYLSIGFVKIRDIPLLKTGEEEFRINRRYEYEIRRKHIQTAK